MKSGGVLRNSDLPETRSKLLNRHWNIVTRGTPSREKGICADQCASISGLEGHGRAVETGFCDLEAPRAFSSPLPPSRVCKGLTPKHAVGYSPGGAFVNPINGIRFPSGEFIPGQRSQGERTNGRIAF